MTFALPHRFRRVVVVLATVGLSACTGAAKRPASDGTGNSGQGGATTGSNPPPAGQGSGGSGTIDPTGIFTGAAGTGAASMPTGAAGAAAAGTSGAAGTAGAAGTTGAAGTGAAGTGVIIYDGGVTIDAGGDAGGVFCHVSIVPVAPRKDFVNLEYRPGAVLDVGATVTGYTGTPKWSWSVGIAGFDSPPFAALDDTGSKIEISLTRAGHYMIKAEVVGAPLCNAGGPFPVEVYPPQPPSFLFRVTPPSGERRPILETTILASDLHEKHSLELGDATSTRVVSITPRDTFDFPLPSFVRLTGGTTTVDLEAYTGGGPFVAALVANMPYDLLIIPDGAFAPLIVRGTPDMITQRMSVTPGIEIAGEARDGANKPVSGARAILRGTAGLPSTIGVSGGDGTFGVLTRAGTLGATIIPPDGSGLAEAHVPADPGIDLRAGTKDMKLVMKWAAVDTGRLKVTVRGLDGTTPVAGARVRVDSSDEIPKVGTLTVHVSGGLADVVLDASGIVAADAFSDANGLADLGTLRAGRYRVVVAPPESASGAATTSSTVTLTAAGLAEEVTLASLVTVVGSLTPADQSAGARITAIDLGVLAPATSASTLADADGRYSLRLAPLRQYELLVDPTPGRGLARAVVGFVPAAASPVLDPQVVPNGLPWSGTVTTGGRRVPGAIVEVFCGNCLDTKLAVAQGVTRADGTLDLVLPDFDSTP
jgi:hypothetical protein